jgi:hypothetical protein
MSQTKENTSPLAYLIGYLIVYALLAWWTDLLIIHLTVYDYPYWGIFGCWVFADLFLHDYLQNGIVAVMAILQIWVWAGQPQF